MARKLLTLRGTLGKLHYVLLLHNNIPGNVNQVVRILFGHFHTT